MKAALLSTLFGFLLLPIAEAQDLKTNPATIKKGFYVFWGYNRETYSRSTIHFKNTTTDNYDFTFSNAKASDKPDMWRYYELDRLTIPQYNLHTGYFFGDKNDLGIEISWDHLKYVVNDNQVMHVTGQVRGHQIDKDTLVTPSFVHLQHTNGNNYLMVNIVKRTQLYDSKIIKISAMTKFGGGPLMSYTISQILGNSDKGYFHYHGWVTGVGADLKANFGKYFFLQTGLQGAFVNYTNTRLGADHVGLSTQHFYSLQWNYGFGCNF